MIWFGLVLWHINHCRLFNAKFILYTLTVLFQLIHFGISTQFSSIWPIDWTLPGATIPGQNGPGRDGNKVLHHIPQSSTITRTSPSDCLVSHRTLIGKGSYPSAENQSVYSTAPADWANSFWFSHHRCTDTLKKELWWLLLHHKW